MCIIAYGIKKDIGNKRFQNCLTNNPDGFFLMGFKKGSKNEKPEYFVRTLLRKEVVSLWHKIPQDYCVLLHARIKTHGSISEKNVHGWNSNGWFFCHNGTLSIQNKNDMTDSETFFRYIFLPSFKDFEIKDTNEPIDFMVNSIIGSSKFVFWKNGKMLFYGDFIKPDKNKFAYFSNYTYESYSSYSCYKYGDSLDYEGLSGYRKTRSYYAPQKKYYSFNSKLIPEKRLQ